MNNIIDIIFSKKGKWIIISLWIFISCILIVTSPPLDETTNDAEFLPNSADSTKVFLLSEEKFESVGTPLLIVIRNNEHELKQKEVSYILESRKQFDLEKLQPLIDEYKRINLKIDQIKVGRGSHEDYSNEKQTLFNLKERIEKEIRIFENSDFINNKSNILKLCKHCGGNGGCLHCNNTGYEDH